MWPIAYRVFVQFWVQNVIESKVYNNVDYSFIFLTSGIIQEVLMDRVRSEIKMWGDKTYTAVDKMTSSEQLAYWLADNIPMTDRDKLQILSLHSPIQYMLLC